MRIGFGIDTFDLDLWVQVGSVKLQIKRNSLGSGHVSHRLTPAFQNRLDYCFIVFKNFKQGAEVRKFSVFSNMIDINQFDVVSVGVFLRSGVGAFS